MASIVYSITVFVTRSDPEIGTFVEELVRVIEAREEQRAEIRVVNVLEHPEEAAEAGVFATPTLIRHSPRPMVRLLGDLMNVNKVLLALGETQ